MDISIKQPVRGEYKQLLECLTGIRGECYYDKKCYSEDYLFGEACDFLAAYDVSGEMAGVLGVTRAFFDDEKTLMGLLNIKPEFSGQGIARKLTGDMTELLRARNVRSLKGHIVTKHTAVQKIVEGFGLIPAGLLYCVRDGKNALVPADEKDTLALYVKNVSVKDGAVLYLHEKIADFAHSIYTQAGASVSIQKSGVHKIQSVIRHSYDEHDSVLTIQVLECGIDLVKQSEALIFRYGDSPAFTVTVLLEIRSPSAIYGYEALCGAGYRFCGFDPLGLYEHALFYNGSAKAADMKKTERLESFYNEVVQYE